MKVLIVGNGGREHALAWHISQSHKCTGLYCTRANPGISECAESVDLSSEDHQGIVSFTKDNGVDLVVIGPEAPLVEGLSDQLRENNVKVFGPSSQAARLEGSKEFMKDLCAKYDIPTASYGAFSDVSEAEAYIDSMQGRVVVKADGLAAGKGVVICESGEDAKMAVKRIISDREFGNAGDRVIIEEFLEGEELSVFAVSDGKTYTYLTSAQDHKRAFDGDTGPNTGGMGAYSPAHMMNDDLQKEIEKKIIKPTLAAMEKEGCPFSGVLYAGIMLVDGEPYVLEFNVRFGDPECQPVMMRLETDLLEILSACAEGKLAKIKEDIYWRQKSALCVVYAAKGYPGEYQKNTLIKGIEEAESLEGVKVFQAGTAWNEEKEIVNTGGRVLGVTALGDSVFLAKSLAYNAISKIDWPDGFYRKDIGYRAVEQESRHSAA
jgi:phosphoribosylamine--glycine ligase